MTWFLAYVKTSAEKRPDVLRPTFKLTSWCRQRSIRITREKSLLMNYTFAAETARNHVMIIRRQGASVVVHPDEVARIMAGALRGDYDLDLTKQEETKLRLPSVGSAVDISHAVLGEFSGIVSSFSRSAVHVDTGKVTVSVPKQYFQALL